MASFPPPDSIRIKLNAMKSPCMIWASENPSQQMSVETKKLIQLESDLSTKFRNKRQEFASAHEDGELVAVKSVENDYKWHRGKILRSFHQLHGVRYQVERIDYGDQVRARPSHLHKLPKDAESLPPQAMLLHLFGLVPLSLKVDYLEDRSHPGLSDYWTPAANKFVNDVLKSYHQAYFVPINGISFGESDFNSKYGDIFYCVNPDAQNFISLSKELCKKDFAAKHEEEFRKIQQRLHNVKVDRPEPCNSLDQCEGNHRFVRSAGHVLDKESHLQSTIKKGSILLEDYVAKQEAQKRQSDQLISPEPSASSVLKKTYASSAASEEANSTQGEKQMSGSSAAEATTVSKPTRANPLAAILDVLKRKSATTVSLHSDTQSDSSSLCKSEGLSSETQSPKDVTETSRESLKPIMRKRVIQADPRIKFLPAGANVAIIPEAATAGKRSSSGTERKQQSSLVSDSDTSESGSSQFTYAKVPMPGFGKKQQSRMTSDSDTSERGASNFNHQNNIPLVNQKKQRAGFSSDSDTSESGKSFILNSRKYDGRRKESHLSNLEAQKSSNSSHEEETANQPSPSPLNSSLDRYTNPAQRSMARPTFSSIRSEEMHSNEQFLMRRVLLHGGLPPRPWMSHHEVNENFSEKIRQILTKKEWIHNVLTLEKYVWPAVLTRQNIVMVSGPKSGKTYSYLIPLMEFMCDIKPPKGNGPVVLILCGGCKGVESVYVKCLEIVKNCRAKVKLRMATGLVLDEYFSIDMVNGCEILVTTPFCLLRLMGRECIVVNLRRLCHFVLDDADVLFGKYLEQMQKVQGFVVAEQKRRMDSGDPIQIIVASEKWAPIMLNFTAHLRSNPIVCINDCLEAVVYGKASVKLHMVQSEKKPAHLIDLLRNHTQLGIVKTVVVCTKEEEVTLLEAFFANECFSYLALKPNDTQQHVDSCLHSWNSSRDGQHYILLCTDSDVTDRDIQDVMCLIHYSLPSQDKSIFVNRLGAVTRNLKNMFEPEKSFAPPQIHVYVDESQSEQLPAVVQLMLRLGEKVEERVLNYSKDVSRRKEESKTSKPLCMSVKMFGDCWDKSSCPNRHTLIPELDSPDGLPNSGEVTMKVLQVHNACHFSVRILDSVDKDGAVKKWPSDFMRIAVMMSDYFSSEANKRLLPDEEIQTGCICAIETAENLFQRVRILDIEERDVRKKPVAVKVQSLDEGFLQPYVKTYGLYYLPESLKKFNAQATDLFVCRLVPCDNDVSWNDTANVCVRGWVQITEADVENSKVFKGQIVFSLRGALWVDPLNIVKLLPHTNTYVSVRNIQRSLLEKQFAFENPGHLQKLYSLCSGHECFVIPSSALKGKNAVQRRVVQPKPSWAFLEVDGFTAVKFSAADSAQCFFVQRKKFCSLLDNMIKDIGSYIEQSKNKEIPILVQGCFCLARHSGDGRWHRAQVLTLDENNDVNVFYVDFGDREVLNRQEIIAIPDWAVTRLPFQAIECSLGGIASLDAVDTLYDMTDDGSKPLQAKVCEKLLSAECTGGNHYVVTLVDNSGSVPSVLNKRLLAVEGVKEAKHQLDYLELNFEECQQQFETSANESSEEEESDLQDVNDSKLHALKDSTAFEPSYCETSNHESKDSILPELEDNDELTINGIKFNFKEIDHDAALDLLLGVRPKNPEKISNREPLRSITCNSDGRSGERLDVGTLTNGATSRAEQPSQRPHRLALPLLSSARPPQIKWYEDLYHVWVRICITGVTKYCLRWTACRIQFSSRVGDKNYYFDQRLRGAICPLELSTSITGFWVQIKIKKACSGVPWKRLFASKLKFGWVKLDHDAAGSSDESDDDFLPTIESFNRGVKKLPLHQRRHRRQLKDGPALPDDAEDDSSGSGDADLLDPDLMF